VAMTYKRLEFKQITKRKTYLKSNKKCVYCIQELGEEFTPRLSFEQVEIDHMLPCKFGGNNDESNARISCRMHNRKFGSKIIK
jgi:5-methylcytosine-specific restriction endonuclease McrA